MSYLLQHLHNGWQVDQAILSEEDRVVIIRYAFSNVGTNSRKIISIVIEPWSYVLNFSVGTTTLNLNNAHFDCFQTKVSLAIFRLYLDTRSRGETFKWLFRTFWFCLFNNSFLVKRL